MRKIFLLISLLVISARTQDLYNTFVSTIKTGADKCGKFCVRCATDNSACDECVGANLVDGECKETLDCIHAIRYDGVGQCLECKTTALVLNADQTGCEALTSPIVGCDIYVNQKNCDICKAGFYISGGLCVERKNTAGCATYVDDLDECLSCSDYNAYFFKDQACHSRTVTTNCATYNSLTDSCITCSSGFYPKDGNCLATRTNTPCKEFSPTRDVCLDCDTGKYISTTGACVSNAAIATVAECKVYSTKTGACQECKEGFYLSNRACLVRLSDLHCKEFEIAATGCKTCETGYYLSSTGFCIVNTVANCATKSLTQNKCLKCNTGLYVNSDGFCVDRVISASGCDAYSTFSDTCNTCSSGYPAETSACVSDITQSRIPNCDIYDDSQQKACKTCSVNYYLSSATTCTQIALASKKANCVTHDPESSTITCKTCGDGFRVFNGDCVAEINGCEEYTTNANTCSKCLPNFYVSAAGASCTLYTKVAQCEVYNPSADSCTQCDNKNYFFTATFGCLSVGTAVSNCVLYDSTKACKECKPEYYLSAANTCTLLGAKEIKFCRSHSYDLTVTSPTMTCLECDYGYNLASDKLSCTKVTTLVDYCRIHSSATQCATCMDEHFFISETSCSLQISVDNRISNCEVYDQTTSSPKCLACSSGYPSATGDACTAFTASVTALAVCDQHSTSTACYKCSANNYLTASKTCTSYSADSKCSTQDLSRVSTGPACSACSSGNVLLSDRTCKTVTGISNCRVHGADETTCTECKSGYLLTSTTLCTAIDTATTGSHVHHCLEHDTTTASATAKCSVCNPGYILQSSGTVCSRSTAGIIDNCLTIGEVSAVEQCTECNSGYYLLDGFNCRKISALAGNYKIEGCVTYEKKIYNTNQVKASCIKCEDGYWRKFNAAVTITPFYYTCTNDLGNIDRLFRYCYEYSSGTCTKCESGYSLDSEKKCMPSTQVTNCLEYDGTKDACSECSSTTYYVPPCTLRKNVNKCLEYTPAADTCAKCSPGYYLSTTTTCTRILENAITNCVEYSQTANSASCTKCRQGSYLSGTTCTPNTNRDNCAIYSTTADECTLCKDTHFRASGTTCTKRTLDPNCSVFSSIKNSCETCNPNYYPYGDLCITQPTIANCDAVKANTDLCETCSSGYYLREDGSCAEIVVIDGCQTMVAQSVQCEKCKDLYFKTEDNRCLPVIQIKDCLIYSSRFNCAVCSATTVRSADSTECLPNIVGGIKIPACESHSVDPAKNRYICDKCMEGFTAVLVVEVSVCVPSVAPAACTDSRCQTCKSPDYYADLYSTDYQIQICRSTSSYVPPNPTPVTPPTNSSTSNSTSLSKLIFTLKDLILTIGLLSLVVYIN